MRAFLITAGLFVCACITPKTDFACNATSECNAQPNGTCSADHLCVYLGTDDFGSTGNTDGLGSTGGQISEVQYTSESWDAGSATISLPITATKAGDLLVVAVGPTGSTTVAQPLTYWMDNTMLGSLIEVPTTSTAVDVWYATASQAGANAIKIQLSDTLHTGAVWMGEFSGFAAHAALVTATAVDLAAMASQTAPSVTPSSDPAVVFSAMVSSGCVNSPASPFTKIPVQLYNDAAFYITPTGATQAVAPSWNLQKSCATTDGVSFNYWASTVAFSPTP